MESKISRGTMIMHRETRVQLGYVMRETNHFYEYQKQPSASDFRRWARVRKDLAMAVPAYALPRK